MWSFLSIFDFVIFPFFTLHGSYKSLTFAPYYLPVSPYVCRSLMLFVSVLPTFGLFIYRAIGVLEVLVAWVFRVASRQ